MKFLPEQYKQFWSRFKSSRSIDTITTRFLLLFLFLLAIPLITVILFNSALLANRVNETANAQLTASKNLLDSVIEESQERLAIWSNLNRQAKGADYNQLCPYASDTVCFVVRNKTKTVSIGENTEIPLPAFLEDGRDLATAINQPISSASFMARWQKEVFLFDKSTLEGFPSHHEGTPIEVLRGIRIDDAFLRRVYRAQPDLDTQIWLIQENEQRLISNDEDSEDSLGHSTQWISLLKELPASQAPKEVKYKGETYRILETPIYTLAHKKIARIAYVLPMKRSEWILGQYYLGIYIIAVASLMFSVILAMIAGRTITQPLLKLMHQVNALSQENAMRNHHEVPILGVFEIRQLGEAFNRMIKRLQQEQKIKDEFVATLTHDLKVPLLAEKQTLTYFQRKAYGELTEEQAEVLQILASSNQSCLKLVNGMLEVYRYDSGNASLILESFCINQLLIETIQELQPLAQEKQIQLTMSCTLSEESDTSLVYADKLEIKRVLHNLVSNAIVNTPSHGSIHCSIQDTQTVGKPLSNSNPTMRDSTLKHPINLEGRLLISIRDSGIGFSHDDLQVLFKQFAANKGRNPMSIGLGLYNCYQVIQAHQGVLWVESTEGEGSIVNFILPRNQKTAQDRRVYRDRRRQS